MTDNLISKRSSTERLIIAKTLLESVLQDMPTVEPSMTPYEFCDAMWRIRIDPDGTPEDEHIKADDLMCELLTKLGYGDGVKEFEKMERWYS